MKIDWYTRKSHLKKWQAITETLSAKVSIRWKVLHDDDRDRPASAADWSLVKKSGPEEAPSREEESEICVVSGVESESAEAAAHYGLNASVRLAILGPVDLNEVLFVRDTGSIESLRETPPIIARLGGLLEKFDGVLAVSEDQAEVIRHHLLIPAKVLRFSHGSDSTPEANDPQGLSQPPRSQQQAFADSFIDFLQEVHQWQPLMRLCDRVGRELAYLGVDEEMSVIALVSKHVSALLPGV
jgi:hypothetical protein